MAAASKLVLVTGATGKQGGAVARHLLRRGHRVLALTRNPESEKALQLARLGATLITGDFENAESIEKASGGVDAVFLMGTAYEAGVAAEVRQGIAAIDATKSAGVPHVVYTSVGAANLATGIPHFDSKFEIEKHLVASGLAHTIIAPVFFSENLLTMMGAGLKTGKLAMALPAHRKLQHITVDAIGAFGALVIDQRAQFLGKRIDLASDELDGTEAAAVLSKVLGKPIEYVEVPVAAVRQQSADMAMMFEWFDRVGYPTDIAALKRTYPTIPWTTFAEWAAKQDWSFAK
jgi:uncharacterized protein YbjT (DUF2867 family)